MKFLKKYSTLDKNKLLRSYLYLQTVELSEIQNAFFKKNNPHQMVFNYPNAAELEASELTSLKTEWSKIGLNKERKFPTVSHMATDAGLIELYEYLYAATSETVHFSPHNLLRNGWSESNTSSVHYYSGSHFYKYYKLFNFSMAASFLFYNLRLLKRKLVYQKKSFR